MSLHKTTNRKPLLLALAAVVLLPALILYLTWSAQPDLDTVRDHVAGILNATSESNRIRHASQCVKDAGLLISEPDPVGATAALYAITAATVAGRETNNVAVPDEDRVETIATQDLLNIAGLFFRTRRFGPADQLVGLALSRNDDLRPEALRQAITIRFDLGRDDDVLAHCEELLKLTPDDAATYRVMALTHRNHGRWEGFIDAMEKVLALDGLAGAEMRVELADAYLRLGNTDGARAEFDRVKQQRPDLIPRAPTVHARLLIQEGDKQQAGQILQTFLKQSPDDSEALILLGTLFVAEERFDEAIATLNKAIQVSPAEEQAYYQLGQAYARSGQSDRADELLAKHRTLLDAKVRLHEMEELASRDPTNVTVRVELAHSYAEIGLMELADFWTRAALAADGR
jgi:tetratricopeptide (TPR) repeat protein